MWTLRIAYFTLSILCLRADFTQASVCDPCAKELQEIQKQKQILDYARLMLTKNQDYIKQYAQSNPSGAIKAKSNIFIITLKIEAATNNTSATKLDLHKKGCDTCLKNT